jgi:hypothetical protein
LAKIELPDGGIDDPQDAFRVEKKGAQTKPLEGTGEGEKQGPVPEEPVVLLVRQTNRRKYNKSKKE